MKHMCRKLVFFWIKMLPFSMRWCVRCSSLEDVNVLVTASFISKCLHPPRTCTRKYLISRCLFSKYTLFPHRNSIWFCGEIAKSQDLADQSFFFLSFLFIILNTGSLAEPASLQRCWNFSCHKIPLTIRQYFNSHMTVQTLCWVCRANSLLIVLSFQLSVSLC